MTHGHPRLVEWERLREGYSGRQIEADGIKLDEPYRKNPLTGSAITYITGPWGTRVELVERGPMP